MASKTHVTTVRTHSLAASEQCPELLTRGCPRGAATAGGDCLKVTKNQVRVYWQECQLCQGLSNQTCHLETHTQKPTAARIKNVELPHMSADWGRQAKYILHTSEPMQL